MRHACLLVLLALGFMPLSGAATDNPLTQTDIGTPGCQTQPLQEADLLQLTPAQAGWLPIGLPEGDPAPPDVQEEIAETVQEVFECLMTGDLARALANYSRAYLAASLGAVRSDLSRPVEGGDQTVAVRGLYEGPWRILQLPDGRVAALLWNRVKDDPHPDPGSIAVWMFIHEDGRWRVDDVNDMVTLPEQERPVYVADLVDGPPAATPSPTP